MLSLAGAALGIARRRAGAAADRPADAREMPRLDEATRQFARARPRSCRGHRHDDLLRARAGAAAPAGQLSTDLKSGERGSSRGARRIYSVLVAGEVALACALLVSSALLVRTVSQMMDTPTGVKADEVLTTTVQLSGTAYRSWRAVAETHAHIIDAMRRQPGVQAAGGGNFLPLEVGLAQSLCDRRRAAAGAARGCAAGAVAQRERRVFRGDGRGDGRRAGRSPRSTRRHRRRSSSSTSRLRRATCRRARWAASCTRATGIGPLGLNLMRRGRPRPARRPCRICRRRFEIVGVVKDVRNVPLGQASSRRCTSPRASSRSASCSSRCGRGCATARGRRRGGAEAGRAERADGAARTWGERSRSGQRSRGC